MAEKILASLDDINTHLDPKAQMGDGDDGDFQVDVANIIKGNLAGVFTPTTLYSWDSPANTPKLIRSIAGRLIAAYHYKSLYSEETTDIPQYAQDKYNEAVSMLSDIRAGRLTVLTDLDVPIEENELSMNSTWFWPNNDTSGPVFTMDKEFG